MQKRVYGNVLDPDKLQKLNVLSNLLMEMTRLGDPDKVDSGTAMLTMYQSKDNSFYKNVYVCGNSVMMTKTPQGGVIYGTPTSDVVECKTNLEMPVRYEMVCNHISKTVGRTLDPAEVILAIRRMARATMIPPWSRERWETIFETFRPCRDLWKSPSR